MKMGYALGVTADRLQANQRIPQEPTPPSPYARLRTSIYSLCHFVSYALWRGFQLEREAPQETANKRERTDASVSVAFHLEDVRCGIPQGHAPYGCMPCRKRLHFCPVTRPMVVCCSAVPPYHAHEVNEVTPPSRDAASLIFCLTDGAGA